MLNLIFIKPVWICKRKFNGEVAYIVYLKINLKAKLINNEKTRYQVTKLRDFRDAFQI